MTKSSTVRNGILLFLLFAAALSSRLIHLGKADLWQDEILLVQTANPDMTVGQVWKNYKNIAVSMAWLPLPAVYQNLSLKAMRSGGHGDVTSSFAQRFPSVLLGALLIPCLVGLGSALGDRRLGWVSGAWGLFNFYFIFYSREIHAYPMLMLLSAVHWLFLANLWGGSETKRRWYILFGMVEIALALTHLTAAFMLAASGLITLGLFGQATVLKNLKAQKHFLFTGLGTGAGLLSVTPYFFAILTKDNPHLKMGDSTSFGGMIYDFVGKVTYGVHVVPAMLGFSLLLAGVFYTVFSVPNKRIGRLLLLGSSVSFLAIALAAKRTQYISARYFMTVAPIVGLWCAAGLLYVAHKVQQVLKLPEQKTSMVTLSVLALGLLPQLIIFLPPYYNLPAKSVDFGAVAKWINTTLEPGTPYLMESAYELRFVGSYYPTPGKVGAAPYVHGGGPGQLEMLHTRQIAFMQQFPEAPFIESAHHNAHTSEPIWSWPHQNFKQHVRLPNDPIRRLINLGIYPGDTRTTLNDTDYHIDIYYNTREDRLSLAQEKSMPVMIEFPGWSVGGRQVSPSATDYFRVAPSGKSRIKLTRLSPEPVKGDIKIVLAVLSDIDPQTVTLQLSGQKPATYSLATGQFRQVTMQQVTLTNRENVLNIIGHNKSLRNLLVQQLIFE